MKRLFYFGLLLIGMTAQAQTARKFTLNLTSDGKAQMVCFLPDTPLGKAIVGVPGGGYSMLSNTHEGYMASDWLNKQGIQSHFTDFFQNGSIINCFFCIFSPGKRSVSTAQNHIYFCWI